MSTKTLNNKYNLFDKQNGRLSVENISDLNSDQTQVILEFRNLGNKRLKFTIKRLTLTAEDDTIDTYIK